MTMDTAPSDTPDALDRVPLHEREERERDMRAALTLAEQDAPVDSDMSHALDRADRTIALGTLERPRRMYDFGRILVDGWVADRRDLAAAAARRGLTQVGATPVRDDGGRPSNLVTTADPTIAALAALSAVDYDRCRVGEAERMGVRVTTLDAEVNQLRRARRCEREDQTSDSLMPGWSVTSWPDAVATADLLDELVEVYRAHVVLPTHGVEAMALWALHAWAHDAATVSPLLVATSPEKRCGKSTVLLLLRYTTPRPLAAATVTPAVLFRAVERWRPTLLLDEADTYLREADELRGLLNSGHVRAIAQTIRCVGDDHEPQTFATWAPKAIACIGRLHDTLTDRAIILAMRRRLPSETVARLRGDGDTIHADLRARAARWAADALEVLRRADPVVPDALGDRAADNWRPLLAIAQHAGGDWPARAREAAVALSGDVTRDTDSARTLLLGDLADMLLEAGGRLASATLVERLAAMEERPWPEWHRGRPITPRQVAMLLRPLGIMPRTLRLIGCDTAKGYVADDAALRDALARYLPRRSVTPSQLSLDAAEDADSIRHVADMLRMPLARNGSPDAACDGVTDGEAGADAEVVA